VRDLTVGHVVPALIGGTLTVGECEPCNGDSARIVENPVLFEGHVKKLRALYRTRPSQGKRKSSGLGFTGSLDSGAKARWMPGRATDDLVPLTAGEPILSEDGLYTFTSPVTDYEVHAHRVIENLKALYPGKQVTPGVLHEVTGEVQFDYGWSAHPMLWPRFAAKIALGLGAEAFGDAWSASHEAERLRALFREGRIYEGLFNGGLLLIPQELVHTPDHRLTSLPKLVHPHEPLVAIQGSPGNLTFLILLFGELLYGLHVVAETAVPLGGIGWLMDTDERQQQTGPLNTIIGRLAQRREMPGAEPIRRKEHVATELRSGPQPTLRARAWHDAAGRGPIMELPPARPV
jgi:hypothetical protein